MFSAFTFFMLSRRKKKDTPYKKYCKNISQKIKIYQKQIDCYISKNGGQAHLERVYNLEPNRIKYTGFYGFILFKLLEERNTHIMNMYVKEHGFSNLIEEYSESNDNIHTYYDEYGNRTEEFNDWILTKAYIENKIKQERIFYEQNSDSGSFDDTDDMVMLNPYYEPS